MKNPLLLIPIIYLMISCSPSPEVYFVDQNHKAANDSGPGTRNRPFKTIRAAAGRVKPGEKVLIQAGIYRETVELKVSGTEGKPIIFEAADRDGVIMRGSVPVTGWNRITEDSPVYIHEGWSKYFGRYVAELRKDDRGRTEKRDGRTLPRNQLFCNGEYIREAYHRDSMVEKSFYIDRENKKICLWLSKGEDPNKMQIEVSDREFLFSTAGNSYININGIRFEHGTNGPQVEKTLLRILGGQNCIVEDCRMEWASGGGFGILAGTNHIARRCVFNHNGQIGFGVSRSINCLMEECESSYNNATPDKWYNPEWEAGGNKIAACYHFVMDRHQAHHNVGPGIWFDISNNECEVKNSFLTYNTHGLFYEISFKLYAHDNVAMFNYNNGIQVAESPYCIVERNILIGNRNGFSFRDMIRKIPPGVEGSDKNLVSAYRTQWDEMWRTRKAEAIWPHDNIVRNNIIAFNTNSQVRGSLLNRERLLPAAIQQALIEKRIVIRTANTAARENPAQEGQPVGLSLEKLNITVNNNIYWGDSEQDVCQWGDLRFKSIGEVNKDLQFESNGRLVDPMFGDWKNLDLRIPAEDPLITMGFYPRGEVPGVKLGVIKK